MRAFRKPRAVERPPALLRAQLRHAPHGFETALHLRCSCETFCPEACALSAANNNKSIAVIQSMFASSSHRTNHLFGLLVHSRMA